AERYGGIPVRVGNPSGFFRTQKVGKRWVFVTSEGNAFWILGVFGIATMEGGKVSQEMIRSKYSGNMLTFANHALERLRTSGFNTVGMYSSPYAFPVPTHGRGGTVYVTMPVLR